MFVELFGTMQAVFQPGSRAQEQILEEILRELAQSRAESLIGIENDVKHLTLDPRLEFVGPRR